MNIAGIYHKGKHHEQNIIENKTLGRNKSIGKLPELNEYESQFSDKGFIYEMSLMLGVVVDRFEVIETIPWEKEAGKEIEAWRNLSQNQEWVASEKGIMPLLHAINSIPRVVTTDCCSGHWDPYGTCYVGFLSDTKEKGYKVLTKVVEYFGIENVCRVTFRPPLTEVIESETPGKIIFKGRLGFFIQFLPEGFYIKDIRDINRFLVQSLE